MTKNNTTYQQEFNAELEDFARNKLRLLYEKLTTQQRNLFGRMYGGIDRIPFEKMPWAYAQVMRTLEKGKE